MSNADEAADLQPLVTKYAPMIGITAENLQMIGSYVASTDPMGALGQVQTTVKNLEWIRQGLVKDAVAAGASWADIGKLLNVSKQAAWERYSK